MEQIIIKKIWNKDPNIIKYELIFRDQIIIYSSLEDIGLNAIDLLMNEFENANNNVCIVYRG